MSPINLVLAFGIAFLALIAFTVLRFMIGDRIFMSRYRTTVADVRSRIGL